MNKKTKRWLILATCFIVVGCIILGMVMTKVSWDFSKISTFNYETNNYSVNSNFKNISIVTDTADIEFIPSKDLETLIVCNENKNLKHSVIVEDDTLLIEINDTRKWYEYIGISFNTPKITIYIPEGDYDALSIKSSTGDIKIAKDFVFKSVGINTSTGDVDNYASSLDFIKINTSTGDISVKNVFANIIDLSVSTGDINITNTNCKNFISRGDTGSVILKNVIATEKLLIESDTGDVKFDGCDSSDILVKTDTGDVIGSFLTEKVFIVKSDTGNIDVPESIIGDKCKITTDTGDIKILIN